MSPLSRRLTALSCKSLATHLKVPTSAKTHVLSDGGVLHHISIEVGVFELTQFLFEFSNNLVLFV